MQTGDIGQRMTGKEEQGELEVGGASCFVSISLCTSDEVSGRRRGREEKTRREQNS